MNSSRPYLLRAIHQWIVDNDCTPFLLVNAAAPGVEVPTEHVENDKIILNIGAMAVQDLALGDHEVRFQARFGGEPRPVVAPVAAVLAIYARENGQGMLFTEEAGGTAGESESTRDGESSADGAGPASRGQRPNLKVIK